MIIALSERAGIDRERGAIGLVARLALHGWRMRERVGHVAAPTG
jgi:hypothetical protein